MASNLEILNAKPQHKDYTINVDTGLSVLVKSTGSKLWRFRYSFSGKRCMISLGKYPQISMKQVKAKVREYMDMLEQGTNPSTHRQVQKVKLATEQGFKAIALEWHAKHYQNSNERHTRLVLQRLEKYIFPTIGKLPLTSIEAPMLFNLIEGIQDMGNIETGKRVNSCCSMIFRYGVAKGYCTRDVTQDYRGMLKSAKPKHMPTLTDTEEIGELLRDMYEYHGTIIAKTALLISAYIFVRPNELVNSKWDFIDFEQSHWLIPAKHMKMKRDHLIPFPKQVKTLLKELQPITEMILMLLGAIGTIVLHFISMGRSFRRQKSFLLGDFHFQQVQSENDFHLFYKTISEAYRRDLQKIAGSKYNISTDQIEAEHRRSDAKRKNHIVPFLVFRKGTPVGGICLFLDHQNEGLPVEHEAKISVDKLRACGSLVEVGRLGILPNFRLNRVILLGLFKCIIEFAAEIRATSILTDSFSWQIKLYSKIGFIPITNDPYMSKNNSTGYGLAAQPLVLDLANMVRLEEQNTTSHEVQDILQPYVIERFFKQLVLKKIIENLFSNSVSIATSLCNFKSKLL